MESSPIPLAIGAGYEASAGVMRKLKTFVFVLAEGILILFKELLFYAFMIGSVIALGALLQYEPLPIYLVLIKWVAVVALIVLFIRSIEWHEGFGDEPAVS